MSVHVIDTIKPKNNGTFPVVEAVDVKVTNSKRLDAALNDKADQSDVTALQTAVADKASQADLTALSETVSGKQNALTETQLAAANSGITSELVTQIGTNTTAIAGKASQADLTALETEVDAKADASDLTTATDNLQAQIDELVTPVTQDAEVQNARVGVDGTAYVSLKARLDAGDTNVINIGNDLDDLKSDVYESGSIGMFAPSDFTNGELTVTSQIVSINTAVKYRIATPQPINNAYEIKATPAAGFRIFVYYVDENQKETGATGWKTEQITIPANSLFMVIIARTTDERSEIADVTEFVSKISLTPSAIFGAINLSNQALSATAQNASDIVKNQADIQVMSEIMLNGSDGYDKIYETAALGEAHSDGQNFDDPRASTTTAIMRELYSTDTCPNIGFDDTTYKALTVYYDENHDFVTFDTWSTTSPVTALSTTSPYVSFEFRRLDNADISQDELATICWTFDVKLNKINSTAFVDGTNGNDTTGKGTKSAPFKTIGKAISFGATNICLKPMTYTENIVIIGNYNKSIHIYSDNTTWGSNVNRPKAIIDGNNTANAVLKISKCKSLILEDIVVQNSGTDQKGCIIEYCQNLQMQNCEFLNNGHDGCVINYTNGVIRDCVANYNGNDGFNMNYYGDTQFINCCGHDNVDDGISHHQGTTGLIDGGEWYNNGKGGVASPAHGAKVDLKNLYCHNNGYGVFANCDSDAEARTFKMWNCVLVDNHANEHTGEGGGYGITCKRNTCLMYNCKIADNDHQSTAPSGGSIIVL